MTDIRQVTITEAARILGLSRRTVQRRVKDGTLAGQKIGGVWYVDVATPTTEEPPTYDMAALLSQVERLTLERDNLAQRVVDLTHDKAYLEQALAMALANQQRALPAPGKRPWWQFWKRGEEQGEG